MPPLLSESGITTRLNELHGWSRSGNVIEKIFDCRDFDGAMEFVNSVAVLAEHADHHPDIDIRWNTVRLALSTQSAGGLTENDFSLAKAIDSL